MSSFDAIIKSARERKPDSSLGQSLQATTEVSVRANSNDQDTRSPDIQLSVLPLNQILSREINTRELRPSHVAALAESIAVLGLVEPLVVDARSRLLAGGHRLAAIKLVKDQNMDAYQQHFPNDLVPVRMMLLDSEVEPERALQVEVAENEHRRDYTPSEVRALAERLRSAGYVDQPGRPTKGTKALRPALEVIIGKSLRTVQRYLNQSEKPRQDVIVSEDKLLKQALKKLQVWQDLDIELETQKRQALAKQLPKFIRLLEAAITEIEAEK